MDRTAPRPVLESPEPSAGRGRPVGAVCVGADANIRTGRAVRRSSSYVVLASLAATLLAACSGGTADEARNAQERDLAETPVLARAQATRIAERYFPPTPSPTPAPPPGATLGALVVTTAIGPGNVPQGSYASVPADAGTVYAGAQLSAARPGQQVEAIWTDAFGNEVGRSAVDVGGSGQTWVAFPLRLGGAIPAGEYAVFVDVDGRRLGSLAFTVSGPGSGAVALADLPTNPQASAQGDPSAPDRPRRRGEGDGGQGDGMQPTAVPGQEAPPPIQPGGPPQGQT